MSSSQEKCIKFKSDQNRTDLHPNLDSWQTLTHLCDYQFVMADDSGFADAIELSDMSVSGNVGRTWRYYTGQPNYRFGDGLSCKSNTSRVLVLEIPQIRPGLHATTE